MCSNSQYDPRGLRGEIGTRCGEKPILIKGVGGREELVRLTPSRNVNK